MLYSQWIPVSDDLPKPEPEQRVLIAFDTERGKKVTMGWYCPANTVPSSHFSEEVDDEYNEEKDEYFLKEQWVDESYLSEYHYPLYNVTHWMPLPSPPSV